MASPARILTETDLEAAATGDSVVEAEADGVESLVRARAYELWQARGCPIGSGEEDWFRAEEELKGGTVQGHEEA